MSTPPICELGFKCPYKAISRESDIICIYPFHPFAPDIDRETFGLVEDMLIYDCPLIDAEAELIPILEGAE